MFKSKYIFETRQTRSIRHIQNVIIFFIFAIFIYISLAVAIVKFARELDQTTKENLFNKTPGMIVVFTGDTGRIPLALKKMNEYSIPQMFITGVYNKNYVSTIIGPYQKEKKINLNNIHIDYLAKNTLENVLSTMQYLREREDVKRILIVSHDYHIYRIDYIISKLYKKKSQKIYYHTVNSDFSKYNNIKKILKEVYKTIRTAAFLSVWDTESDKNYIIPELLK